MPPDDLLRYLHSKSAAPGDGVTDGELLRRYTVGRDDVAFELLMRRYADLVWRICRAVARDHHVAEDAFQATFLAFARKSATIGAESVAGWLCRVACHAALKTRPRPMTDLIDEPRVQLDETTEQAEIAHVLHEELNRLADRYRVPLVLCYLQDFTHAQAGRQLGWPVGTVATRVARGRDRLRDRLIRRGVVLSSGGVVAVLSSGSVSALPPDLIPTTARAIANGSGLSASVQHLTQGVLSAMPRTRIWPIAAAITVALAASVTLAFTGSADPPVPPAAPTPAAKEKEKEKAPVERPTSISPGIQTLVTFSTDVVVADVLETNPSKAMEGARDTVKLKVVRTLLGRPVVGDVLGVYYHLLWSDEKGEVLESPKFLKGKRYVVFLQSHRSRTPEGERVEYQLTDQWLSVLPDHVHLVKEVVAAIRTAHGDSRGEWSSTDGSIAGLQGRLVAYREAPATGNTPFIIVFLDLRNTAGGDNTTEFNLDAAKVVWTVTDAKGKAVDPVSPPGSWKSPPPRKLTLEAKQSGRLPVTVSGAGVFQGKAGHLDFGVDQVWEFAQGEGPFFLSGKIKIEPIAQARTWYGTMDLPKVRIPLGE